MSKTAYYTHSLKNGGYFDTIIVPDDFPATYPITGTPIPEDLQATGTVPQYNWVTATWEDASNDAQKAKELQRDEDLSEAQKKIANQEETINLQAIQIKDLQSQLAEAQDAIVEVAQLALPSTGDTANATPTTTTSTTTTTTTPDEDTQGVA